MNDSDTVPSPDAARTTQPGQLGGVVVDYQTYLDWVLGKEAARDVVEKVVGFE